MFLVSLNEKGSFFKPIMFEFPEDKNSYNDIESKVMLGEAFLILVFFGNEEKNKTFILPNSNFNSYPSGDTILTYSEKSYSNLRKKNLSGKLNELYIFLRGGYIVPTQNTFDKYIMNTYSLRHEKLNLIINPNQDKYAKGTIFYDNDESDTIENEKYIRVDMEFKDKILNIDVKNLKNIKYKYKDNIINKIEILRMDEIIDINKYKNNIKLKIELTTKKNKNIKAKLDINNNKIIIDFNAKKLDLNLFTLKKIYLN
jgi:alpha-glucosidase (family GH31 glycosyl hydrolase)